MQAIGQQPKRAPDGTPVHCECHRPEQTTLYRLGQQHAATFIAKAEAATGVDLPQFVKNEFDVFLECGILARGFLRLRCSDCGHDRLVAFTCMRRGFCPSCGARRMAQTAAHLVVDACTGLTLGANFQVTLPTGRRRSSGVEQRAGKGFNWASAELSKAGQSGAGAYDPNTPGSAGPGTPGYGTPTTALFRPAAAEPDRAGNPQSSPVMCMFGPVLGTWPAAVDHKDTDRSLD